MSTSRNAGKNWTRRAFISSLAAFGGAGTAAMLLRDPEENMNLTKQQSSRLPTLYLPHGGGPCFFMDWTMGPPNTWDRMATWLRSLGQRYYGVKAIVVISAHWEERVVTVQTGGKPPLLFDYYGFPQHTYEIRWPAPGAPEVATRARALLQAAGIDSKDDEQRGFDHGVFVPLKVAFPEAAIPTFQLSLGSNLDAATHLRVGRALAPLRDEGVLIIGSGMSFHNMKAMMNPGASLDSSKAFDAWLRDVCEGDPDQRETLLSRWEQGPNARYCHPREEHLLPLMTAAGAAPGESGHRVFHDQVLGVEVSAFEFGEVGVGTTSTG